ncbi:hypothetical protein [Pedobacter sp. MW01-1-1]|uniref:hypothetical protein n=1 Tax=Pedobacter sp. MW01-1-1 TaxID=3383027 RepID=UPI003FEFA32E
MNIHQNWFDNTDITTPYKATGTKFNLSGEKIISVFRFATKEEALKFHKESPGRCLVSHHNYTTKQTKIIAYKFK